MTFACGRTTAVKAQVEFCDAALAPVGFEFTHIFPWLIFDCLKAEHIKPQLETVDQYTGIAKRNKVKHLWAGWPDGTRIDILFRPTDNLGLEPKWRDYWGAYELVIWLPLSPE